MRAGFIAIGAMAAALIALHVHPPAKCPFGFSSSLTMSGAQTTPMLGFVLGRTTRAEALASKDCAARRGEVECTSGARTTWLAFSKDGRLALLRSAWRDGDAAKIRAAFDEARARVHAEARGDPSLALTLQQISAETRDASLRAVIRATNMGDGYLLTEEYRAL